MRSENIWNIHISKSLMPTTSDEYSAYSQESVEWSSDATGVMRWNAHSTRSTIRRLRSLTGRPQVATDALLLGGDLQYHYVSRSDPQGWSERDGEEWLLFSQSMHCSVIRHYFYHFRHEIWLLRSVHILDSICYSSQYIIPARLFANSYASVCGVLLCDCN